METELQDIKKQQEAVQFSSYLSTERSIALLDESQVVAEKTSKALVEQREKLERTSDNIKRINESLKVSQKNINKMKGFFSRLKNMFPSKKESNDLDKSSCVEKIDDTPTAGSAVNNFEKASDEDEACLQTIRESNSDSDSDDLVSSRRNSMDERIDANLATISSHIANLKTMAVHMGEEIVVQNGLLDNIRDDAERVDTTIAAQDLQIKKLLN